MYEPFFLIGLILVMGFAANLLFDRTRISQVLILVALGFLIGPVLGIVDVSEGSPLSDIAPFVGALALIILLFDGGITLNLFDLVRVLPKATAFTVLVFILSVAATAGLAVGFLGWSLLQGVLLGAVLGGTSSAIVIALVEKSGATRETRTLLSLESALTDVLCIVTAVVVLQLIKANAPTDPSTVLNLLVSSFSIAILAGAIAAIAWLTVLNRLGREEFPYMLTLAAVFILYAAVEAVGGNGGIAVFAFGLVLGNAKRVADFLKLEGNYALDGELTYFQEEVTFFTRTFFFVFLGLILDLGGITANVAVFAFAMSLIFLAIRWMSKKLVLSGYSDAKLITTMLPRGLAAAVLAGLPAAQGVRFNGGFEEITLLVIVLTNIIATAGLLTYRPNPQGRPRVISQKEQAKK